MPKPIALQLYSLRDQAMAQGFPQILKLVAEMGYSGVEFAGLHGMAPAEVKKIVDDLGLKVAGAHTAVFDPARVAQTIDEAKVLGATQIGGGFGPKDFETEDQIKVIAARANTCIEQVEKAGLKAYLHNHWWEWDGPNKGALLLKLCPKLYTEFDIYWIQTAGADPAKLVRKYAKRALLLHVKDGPCEKGQPMTAVGKGKVNTVAVLQAAEKSICEWHIVELDSCGTDMIAAVRDSYTYLVGTKLATGTK